MWRNFFLTNPYDGFPLDRFERDIQGWGGGHLFFSQVIENIRPQLVIEIGTWKGFSALYMAYLMEQNKVEGKILCIDTWLGSAEHFFDREPMTAIRRTHGFPNLYEQFLANVIFENRQDVITPLPQTSDGAFLLLSGMGIVADAVYVDGAHDYETVSRDLKNYWSLVRKGGVLFGDDYQWAGVKKAVDEFVRSSGAYAHVWDGKYLFQK